LKVESMAAPIGNQNAKNAKRWQYALRRALARAEGTIDSGLDKIADKVVAAAIAGERWAVEEVGNREDGKPAQAVAVSGDGEGGAIPLSLSVGYVDPATTET
jgi:hypothetical protein